jgi:hypothetical protein
MANKLKPIRQGDVWLVPLSETEQGLMNSHHDTKLHALRRTAGQGIIVAAGEATGHHHRILAPKARLLQPNSPGLRRVISDRLLRSPKGGCTITHEEHAPLEIPEGLYKVVIAREYAPSGNVRVRD